VYIYLCLLLVSGKCYTPRDARSLLTMWYDLEIHYLSYKICDEDLSNLIFTFDLEIHVESKHMPLFESFILKTI
jgi:hypothetical protein